MINNFTIKFDHSMLSHFAPGLSLVYLAAAGLRS